MSVTSLPKDYPPVLYVPCAEKVVDPADLTVHYRQTRDGRTALLVYSALDRLHAAQGEDQPWFVIATARLQALYDARAFDVVLLDLVVPEEFRTVGAR